MTVIFSDGVMEATYYPEGWLFLRWLNNKVGRLSKQLVMDLMWAERHILQHHLKGWFTSSEIEHKDFQKILHKVGARFMSQDTDFVYLNKWLEKEGDKYVWKRTVRTPVTSVS